ncbi:MAG: hypothetical protein SFT81_06625 [Candidatus Caenarcaniphilales bacterium]|nr:hypothetical protein [Candidatus Caenarcaniphilales bacterium]
MSTKGISAQPSTFNVSTTFNTQDSKSTKPQEQATSPEGAKKTEGSGKPEGKGEPMLVIAKGDKAIDVAKTALEGGSKPQSDSNVGKSLNQTA